MIFICSPMLAILRLRLSTARNPRGHVVLSMAIGPGMDASCRGKHSTRAMATQKELDRDSGNQRDSSREETPL